MKRPRYRELGFKMLEILATQADSGILLRSVLQKHCKAPKSSMSDVLKDLASRKLIHRAPWFSNQEKIEITEEGRQECEKLKVERLQFPIPYPVKTYLECRTPKVTKLFPIQQAFVDRGLLHSRNNVCVFGYPGSGKTLVAEMAMAGELDNRERTLYCTPYKALDWQKYNDFKEWFGKGLGKKVVITDGDNPVKVSDLLEAEIVIATYERALGAIRTNEQWLKGIALVCADEITLLDDEERGGELDLLLTYFKLQDESPRIITLSSLVGNPLQISEWLNAEPVIENRPLPGIRIAEYLVYKRGNELVCLGRDGKKFVEKLDRNVIEHLLSQNLKKGETTLVFVGARHETEHLALKLRHYHEYDQQLAERANSFFETEIWEKTRLAKSLCDLIGYGIAFHHAGVQRKARKFVEQLMRENVLKTIVATTTLSHGVDYGIDNVIIDLPAILKIHELHGYEYINLKGRTGRFGKSKSASVYILTDEKLAETMFNKYFLGSPEAIFSSSTFDNTAIATAILLEAGRTNISPNHIAKTLAATLCALRVKARVSSIKRIMKELVDFGFLKRDKSQFLITELGKKVNTINLSPYDAMIALSLTSNISMEKLLDVASNIDLARRVRRSILPFDVTPSKILLDWINEMPLDSIKSRHGSNYNDHDIVELGKYTSLSLQKISSLISDRKLKKRINILQERVKYGIKTDLAETALMRLLSFSRDNKRALARSFSNSGINSINKLAKEQPETLVKNFGISSELASQLVLEAKAEIR